MTTYRTLIAYLETASGEHPNLDGYNLLEIWDMLPDQDARHDQGTDGLRDMLNDIPYRDEEGEAHAD